MLVNLKPVIAGSAGGRRSGTDAAGAKVGPVAVEMRLDAAVVVAVRQ